MRERAALRAWTAAHDLGETRMTLVMAGVKHKAVVRVDDVAVTADLNRLDMRLFRTAWQGRPLWFDYAHTGTEHAVAFVDNVDDVDAEVCGRLVRHHEALTSVGGANVNFVQVLPGDELRIRTYERGVEAETLSCGSGSVAATAVARVRGLVSNGGSVTVHNRSGTPLTVQPTDFPGDSFWVSGLVSYVFRGELA
ncbi:MULTISPECIES: hypothetical protein [Streptomyces]|uniref:hypothetical protein n=1 Tax=Streptomyces TaxID=1883 RepID=UPI0023DD0BF4|nr:hypothetical protein [Streptomyces sp. FXJ1.172]WEP00773.1 hypothetical protein A6P39_042125 [Streptomyces sp. FXJ1.172]